MGIKKLFNIEKLKNTDFFNIRRFVFLFLLFSLISISSADLAANQDKKINQLSHEVKVLKSKYVSTKTILMTKSKRSYLLKKAEKFNFFSSEKPLTTIYLKYEN